MRKMMIIPMAALAAVSFPLLAQDVDAGAETMTEAPAFKADAEQQAQIEAWSTSQQESYAVWPAEVQSYFWDLTPERQDMFWHVRDSDKLAVIQSSPENQAQAWATIESQFAAHAQAQAEAQTMPESDPMTDPSLDNELESEPEEAATPM